MRTGDSDRRTRILLVSPLPPPAGGVASWTERLLTSPALDRFEVEVVDINPGARRGVHPEKIGRYLRMPVRFARALARFRPDLVHLNSASRMPHLLAEHLALELARRHGAKTVLHFRGSTLGELRSSAMSARLVARAAGRADAVFTQNNVEIPHLRELGITRIKQCDNFVAARPWQARERHGGPTRFVYVGWVMREKGLLELLEALAHTPDAELTVVGRSMDLTGEISARIDALRVRDRVRLCGEVPLEQTWRHYEQADVFVLPSWSEGFPNVLAEAMMAGLPAICTPVGSVPEVLVDGRTGLLVPTRDASALAAAMRRLAANTEEREQLGRAGWERAMSRYQRDVVVRSIALSWEAIVHGRFGDPVEPRSA